ncbi:NAD(P)/FAD-dependent oxidoreductase [Actibacterium sp. D379-3]
MQVDVVIVGGAVMGSAAAFWLSRMDPALSVVVVESDPTYARASTALSVASIRQQFSNPINVKISLFGIEFIRNIASETGPEPTVSDLGFRENGYLFLAGEDTAAAMLALQAMQCAQGAGTEILEPDQLAARFPYLALGDVRRGSFGPRDEGWFDNMGLLHACRSAARRAGVQYRTGRVAGLIRDGGRVCGVTLDTGARIMAGAVVNAAGPRAADLLRGIGEDMPVEPRKRTVFLIDAPNARHPDAPLLVDHTGFYLRPEHNQWICATVPQDDHAADPQDFEPEYDQFETLIWEKLYARAPGFDAVKVLRAWAGHYAYNTLDQNAIIGRWPGLAGLYVMNGFSGHGLQQAPAVGRAIAELILHGGFRTLDLRALGPERIFENRPFRETEIV